MTRPILIALAGFTLMGCVNWQASYDSGASVECRQIIDPYERQDCLDAVARNAAKQRDAQRS